MGFLGAEDRKEAKNVLVALLCLPKDRHLLAFRLAMPQKDLKGHAKTRGDLLVH